MIIILFFAERTIPNEQLKAIMRLLNAIYKHKILFLLFEFFPPRSYISQLVRKPVGSVWELATEVGGWQMNNPGGRLCE
jgi:hypothetical protein